MNEPQIRRFNPKVGITTMLTPEYALEIEQAARSVGLTRHAVLVRAIKLGLPLALAQAGYQVIKTATASTSTSRSD